MNISTYPDGFPQGLSIQELPIMPAKSGKVFWVNNSTTLGAHQKVGGSNGNPGTYTKPFQTIDYAIGQCTADRGDLIYAMEGHSEDLDAAADIDVDVDGVTIIGLGQGDKQAKVTFSNASATFEINADNVTVKGLHFQATVTAVAKGIDIVDGADDYRIVGNRFSAETLGTDEFEDAIFVTTSDRGVIANNTVDMDEAGAASAIHFAGVCLGAKVFGNSIQGDYSVACIEGVTTASEMVEIFDNRLINGVHSGLNTVACISLFTGTTGFIENNKLYCNVATPDLAIVADGCFLSGNKYSETAAGADEDLYATRQPDSTYNYIGVDDSNNAAATTNVAANEDGSILERLEQVQEAVNKGTGTALGANESLVDVLSVREDIGEADIDVSEADYTSFQALITITPNATSPMEDVEIYFDLAKATTGFVAGHTTETIQFAVARKIDGTNWRRDIDSSTTARAANVSGLQGQRVYIGHIGPDEEARVEVVLSAENAVDVELPYALYYRGNGVNGPTITPVAAV